MLPRCGSFLSVLPRTLARLSDLAGEQPGFLSREGSWHSNSQAVPSGMPPSPTCLRNGQTSEKSPLPVAINYKRLAHFRSLSRVAAGASYKDAPSWKGGCRNTKLHSSDKHHLLYVLPPSPDPYRGVWAFWCKENILMEMQAGSGCSFPKHPFSLLDVKFLIVFIFFSHCFFLYYLTSFGEKKKHTHKHTHTKLQQGRKLNFFTKMLR